MSTFTDPLIPKLGIITDIRTETPDVKTFRVNAPEGGKVFEHMPGQCAMLSLPGIGEADEGDVAKGLRVFLYAIVFAVLSILTSHVFFPGGPLIV